MSSRYLCLHCWRILPEAETRLQPENLAPPAPAAVLPAAPAPAPTPVMVATPAPASVPATRHWLQDPNAAAVPVAAAVPAAPAVPAAAAVPSPAPAPRKPLLGFLDSVLGESDDDDPVGGRKARHQERGHRFCVCGATLGSHSRLDGQPSLLGFAGARSAGKTILLLSTLHQLDRAEALDGREISLLGVGDTEERFRALRHEFFVHRQKPGATVPDAPIPTGQAINSYCWTLRTTDVPTGAAGAPRPDAARRESKNGSGRAQLFGIFDVAGESWRDLKRDGNHRLLRYLDLLGLLFFVVDGAALADDLGLDSRDAWNESGPRGDSGAADMQIFSALCERLGPRTRDISLAIVISKADLLWDAEPWRGLGPESPIDGAERQNLVARLLKESCRGSLFPEARQLFRRVGLFAVSGLGFRPEAGDVSDDHKLARQPHPHNVLEPLHFLLEDHLPRRKN